MVVTIKNQNLKHSRQYFLENEIPPKFPLKVQATWRGIVMNEDHTGCLSEAKAERKNFL